MSTGYYCYVSSQTDTSSAKGITIFDVEPTEGRLIRRKVMANRNRLSISSRRATVSLNNRSIRRNRKVTRPLPLRNRKGTLLPRRNLTPWPSPSPT
jgi:hypothetical protein